MSNEIFPTLPGLTWNQTKTPIFKTRIEESVSGKEAAWARMVYPRWVFKLSYELLRDRNSADELQQLVGLYLRHQGAADSFLFKDISDFNQANQFIATGNGTGNNFQMIRTYGNFAEPVYSIMANSNNTPIVVKIDGNAWNAANYTLNLYTGALTFAANNTPANGANISAQFSYYYRVRFFEFDDGSDAFSQFMSGLFEAREIRLISKKP